MSRYSEADIERAIRTVASLIDRFGDAYWPILERLEQETGVAPVASSAAAEIFEDEHVYSRCPVNERHAADDASTALII